MNVSHPPPRGVVFYTPRERLMILGFALIGTIFDGTSFAIFIYFLHPLAVYFHTSLFALTVIQSLSYVTGIAGGILFGHIADRRGRRLGLALTIGLFSVATFASAFSSSYGMLAALRILAGLGIGGESGIAFAYLNEAWRSQRRGFVNSFLQAMFIIGSFAATLLFQITSGRYGVEAWRWAFGWIGVVAILALLVRVFMPESKVWKEYRERRDSGEIQAARVSAIFAADVRRTTILMTVLMAFGFFGSYAVITYGPSVWMTVYHASSTKVAVIGYWASLATFVSYIVWGTASDRFGRRPMMIGAAIVGTLGYLFFAVVVAMHGDGVAATASVSSLVVFYAYLWMQFGYGYSGVQGVWMAELFPTDIRATASNFAYYVGRGLGAGIAPLAALAVAERLGGDARVAIAMGAVGTLGVVGLSLLLPESKGKALQLAVGRTESVLAE